MVKKVLLIGLLGVSLMVLIGNEASARVCVVKNADGSCKLWSGSLECGIGATGLGNVAANPTYLSCEGDTSGVVDWVVGCGNPGSNNLMAPGVNTVSISATLTGTVQVLPEQVDRNGKAYVSVFARPDQDLLANIQALYPEICPNANWIVTDAVPCLVNLTDSQIDENNCITADATFSCFLPSCNTLGIDKKTKRFERREFICTQTGGTVYNTPICQ